MRAPRRGEVWLADPDPTRGREQAGRRPVLVLSHDLFNRGPADLVVVSPNTYPRRPHPPPRRVAPPEGGLRVDSAVLCEAVRSVSKRRLRRCFGRVSASTLDRVEDALRILLDL